MISKKTQTILAVISIVFAILIPIILTIVSPISGEAIEAGIFLCLLFFTSIIILSNINIFSSKERWIRVISKLILIIPALLIFLIIKESGINDISSFISEFTHIGRLLSKLILTILIVMNTSFILSTIILKPESKKSLKTFLIVSEIISLVPFIYFITFEMLLWGVIMR